MGEKIKYNWGDWYAYDYFTCFRVFGFEGKLYRLPILVLDKIAYFKIVSQMLESRKQHFGGKQRKQTFLPTILSFGDFTICATKSYDKIGEK